MQGRVCCAWRGLQLLVWRRARGSVTPLMALLCSSTSTRWRPPSFRRCFSRTPLHAPPSTSCSTTSFLPLATSPPVCPSPASPSLPGFPLLPAAWTPAAGSLSQSSTKVNRSLVDSRPPQRAQASDVCVDGPELGGAVGRAQALTPQPGLPTAEGPFPQSCQGRRAFTRLSHTCRAQKGD